MRELGVEAATDFYQLKRATRPAGLGPRELNDWAGLRHWVESQAGTRAGRRVARLLKVSSEHPLAMMPSARWLPKSDLSTPGPWRHWSLSQVLPPALHKATLRAALIRRDHSVIVGTSAGLLVRRRGFWEWFGFDEARSVFSPNLPYDKVGAGSSVLSLAESDDGTLYIGTETGLVTVKDHYSQPIKVWRAPDDGLPASRIDALAPVDGGMFVGTPAGARVIASDGSVKNVDGLADQAVVQVSTGRFFDRRLPLLAITPKGLYEYAGDRATRLATGGVSSAVWDPDDDVVVFQRGQALYQLEPHAPKQVVRLPDQQDLVSQEGIAGLAAVPIKRDGSMAVVAMTDLGLSFYKDAHFEHLGLESVVHDADRRVGVTAVSVRDGRACLLTTAGIVMLELGQQRVDPGKVYDARQARHDRCCSRRGWADSDPP
jgi:hypothetical protein